MTPRNKKIVFLAIIGALVFPGLFIVHDTLIRSGPDEPRVRRPEDFD